MGATALAIVRLRSLFAVVMLSGIYSFLAASMFMVLDAVDVAFTEAAVGAGISTVLMLGVLTLTKGEEKVPVHQPLLPLLVVVITGAALIYATFDMPTFADPNAPANLHVAPDYLLDKVRHLGPDNLDQGFTEVGIPNVVTSVLASYRGYDTLGEVTVIFTAGVALMMLLAGRAREEPGAELRPGIDEGPGQTAGEGGAGPARPEDEAP